MSQTAILLGLEKYTLPAGVARMVLADRIPPSPIKRSKIVMPPLTPVHNMVAVKHRNAGSIITAIKVGCRTITEISEYTGIGRTTVFTTVRDLTNEGQVIRNNKTWPLSYTLPKFML